MTRRQIQFFSISAKNEMFLKTLNKANCKENSNSDVTADSLFVSFHTFFFVLLQLYE